MKKGGILIGVLLIICISILMFSLFSSSIVRTHGLTKNRTIAEKAYYKTEAVLHDLNTDPDSQRKLKQILAKNMSSYTGSFQRMELFDKLDFSNDWTFHLYPGSDSVNNRSYLDISYHNRVEGAHCELTGSFSFENELFFSETGVIDSSSPPRRDVGIQNFIEECTEEWVPFSKKIFPDKDVKDLRFPSVIRVCQKPSAGYELRSYLGSSGEHSLSLEDFDSHASLNTAGKDSELTTVESRTDVYLDGVINGFPRTDPTVLFGTYVLDGDLYVNTDSRMYGILILKGGRIILGEGVKFSVHGLLISEVPVVQTETCKVSFDYKYMLREAVTLPNFLNLQLVGIRE